MSQLPDTWLASDAGRNLGVVEFECAPCQAERQAARHDSLVFIFGITMPLLIMGSLLLALVSPPTSALTCGLAPVVWIAGVALVVGNTRSRLQKRLIVARNGIGLWEQGQLTVALWQDLGVLWQVRPGEPAGGSLLLWKADGTRLEITPFFERSAEVIARVLAEYAPRAGMTTLDDQIKTPAREPARQAITRVATLRADRGATPALLPGPWLDSAAARVIGPVEKVCAPTWAEVTNAIWLTALAALLVPIPLAILTVCACNVLYGRQSPLGGPQSMWVLFFVAWIGIVLAVLVSGVNKLSARLLLGARGIARWSDRGDDIVLWEELGTVWRCVPGHPVSGEGLAVVLENSDGRELVINGFFADHHVVALRVLEELTRRQSGSESEKPPLDSPSESIKPDQRDIAEPDA
jgi:hypothetical protein